MKSVVKPIILKTFEFILYIVYLCTARPPRLQFSLEKKNLCARGEVVVSGVHMWETRKADNTTE